jgi:hypothetical protein
MRLPGLAAVFAMVALSTPVLQAQETDSSGSMGPGGKGMMMGQGMQMAAMDSMNARLDALVGRMNRATGNAKVTLMAQVINEMVAQRKAMQAHMRAMMQSHAGMMGMGQQSNRPETVRPKPADGAAAADTAHAEHHPQK